MNRLLTPLMLLLAMVGQGQGQAHAQPSALELETGQGRILRFGNDVASVFVANPDIADVQVVSPGVIYVFGKQHGDTNLIALANVESTQASMRLHVSDGDQGANRALQNADAVNPIQLCTAGNQLVAEGQTHSIEGAIATQSTLEQHAPAEGATLNNATYSDATQINLRVRFAEKTREEKSKCSATVWPAALSSNGNSQV